MTDTQLWKGENTMAKAKKAKPGKKAAKDDNKKGKKKKKHPGNEGPNK
jgi:hypothetical protein